MATEQTAPRILVPIDLQGISKRNLETLVHIARQLDRGLLGLLLEDVRLQRVADLPFTTEITLASGTERSLQRAQLSQQYTRVSSDTRHLLGELAHRNRVELVFESAVGGRLHTAFERNGQQDIFFPARQRWRLVSASPVKSGTVIRRLGMVLADTAQDAKVVDCANLLQQAGLVGEIHVLSHRALERGALDRLFRPGRRICVQANLSREPSTISRLIRQSAYDLLLLPRDCLRGITQDTLESALNEAGGQVLVVN